MQGSTKTDSRLRRAQSSQRLRGIIFPVVAAVSILTAFWGLAGRAVGNHEAYVAVTAREMVNSGNWVMPFFNGEPRLQKTPLSYWLIAAAAKAAGSVNSFVVRLPSAVLAVLSAVAIFYFVSDRLGMRIAALSSLIWSTSLCYIRYSHTGRPEMALTAFVSNRNAEFLFGGKSSITAKTGFLYACFLAEFFFCDACQRSCAATLDFSGVVFLFCCFSPMETYWEIAADSRRYFISVDISSLADSCFDEVSSGGEHLEE